MREELYLLYVKFVIVALIISLSDQCLRLIPHENLWNDDTYFTVLFIINFLLIIYGIYLFIIIK